nr:hypothetical protein [Tanacetum cinerariifolium]
MSLTFADTHNMVVHLNKSDASEGFNQIIDFLNGSYIKHALTKNPHIYVSCIKQFWNTVVVKQFNDITRLQALVDKKKVVITEATIRDALCLDDAEGVDCLPNEEIFAELARMGYEKPSIKLTFYKDFFSSQWKFLIHTILQSLSAKRTSWNKFSSTMVHSADHSEPTRRVGKGFSVVETPLFEGMLVAGELEEQGDAEEQEALDTCVSLARRVEHLEYDKVAQALEITKLKRTVKKLERGNKAKVLKLRRLKKVGTSQKIESSDDTNMEDASNQGRMIDELDRDEGVALMDDEGAEKKAEEAQEDEPEVVDVVTTAKLITEVVTAASESVTTASTTIAAAEPQVSAATGMSYDDIRPIFEAKFNLNIEFLLKSKEQLEEEENRAIQSINETPAQKAAKRRKLNKEVEDLKQHLEIVPDEDDDVYTEATRLARKVPVVDYEIIHFNNKPHYKIIRADGTHQLPDGQAQVWKNQRIVHGQARVKCWKILESCSVHIITFTTTQLILLVERRYLLSRFTLDQSLNAVRLRVEEQSEMSLELLSFGVDVAMDHEENTKCLMLLTNDVTRLQALVDRKKVVITEAAIRDPSTKLTFYKAFFSSQWKFLIHTILQSMSAKRTSWNEFSSAMASVVICLSTGDLSTHTTKYTSPALTQKVFANMRRVGKVFSGVETPLFEGMLVAGVIEEEGDAEEQVQDDVDDAAAQGADTAGQGDDLHAPSIPSPTPPTLPPQQSQDLPSTSQVHHTPPQSPQP